MLVLGTVATILPIFSMMIVAIAEENTKSLIDFLPKILDINQNFVGIVLIIAGFFFLLIGKFSGGEHSEK
jgi:threonine/homoserine/homoserine lactone efflux protein